MQLASFLLYLSDVEEGGETMFPFEVKSNLGLHLEFHFTFQFYLLSELFNLQNGLNMDGSYGYQECIGLRVRPRRGDGLLFYSLFHNGTIDPVSIYASSDI